MAASIGSWTSPANLCASDGLCTVGANATLLNTGNVVLWYYPTTTIGSPVMLLNPVTGAVTDVSLPYAEDVFCSGMTVMPDGRLLVTGGNPMSVHDCPPNRACGTYNANIFDPASSTWSQAANMIYSRWYPTSLTMPDGTALTMAGQNASAEPTLQMETYNETTGAWTQLPASADYPGGDSYPRVVLLPDGLVFKAENLQATETFNPATNTWTFLANTNFGNRYYGGAVLLPGLEKVLIAGGSPISDDGTGTSTNTAEVINFSAKTPAWSYTGSMNYSRMNENLVLLPNETVLAVGGGGGSGKYSNPIEQAELYSPTSGTWTVMAAQTAQRTYHSTAVLLLDGRVLSAGSDYGDLETTYEIYSPPYLFQGTRPTITSVPTSLTYGAKFTISTPDYAYIKYVALMRAGSTTHADDFDQRYVNLSFTNSGSNTLTATAPANANLAPPGYYTLVIVNKSGVPSVMQFVQVSQSQGAKRVR
ncbi:MAG TPA: galactose oxidase-like domain-containing protein [Terriglobia bacterium]|nr:galactose oxidase-like domain-containing protein [Terriglobia bacterium]